MKINSNIPGLGGPAVTGSVSRGTARASNGGAPTANTANSDADTVQIDPRASLLAAAESSLGTVPTVDTARVEAVKQAIAQGRFSINSEVIADRLLNSVKDLILTQR
jgi:negative regulator of flagellin synthesis FlgM